MTTRSLQRKSRPLNQNLQLRAITSCWLIGSPISRMDPIDLIHSISENMTMLSTMKPIKCFDRHSRCSMGILASLTSIISSTTWYHINSTCRKCKTFSNPMWLHSEPPISTTPTQNTSESHSSTAMKTYNKNQWIWTQKGRYFDRRYFTQNINRDYNCWIRPRYFI